MAAPGMKPGIDNDDERNPIEFSNVRFNIIQCVKKFLE